MSFNIWNKFHILSSINSSPWTKNYRDLISVQKIFETIEVDKDRYNREKSNRFSYIILDFETKCTTNINIQEIYKALNKLNLSFELLFINMRRARFSTDKYIVEIFISNIIIAISAHFEYSFIIYSVILDSYIYSVFLIDIRYN